MAFWPALLLARSERLPWALRGVLAGGAVLLAEVALLSQSRGSLYATPVMLVLVFALLPGRVRTFALLVPVAAGIGARGAGGAARRRSLWSTAGNATARRCTARPTAMFAGRPAGRAGRGGRRGDREPGILLGGHRGAESTGASPRWRSPRSCWSLAGGWAAAGDPVTRVRHGWDTFKGG